MRASKPAGAKLTEVETLAALQGFVDAHKGIEPHSKLVLDWLAGCASRILEGEEPNAVFNVRQSGQKGRRAPFDRHYRVLQILVATCERGRPLKAGTSEAALKFGVSRRQI